MNASVEEIYLARQPIVDKQKSLIGFELLFRSPRKVFLDPQNGMQATSTVIANAFADLGIDEVLGPYLGFINVTGPFLFSELVEVLPKERVVLEMLEDIVFNDDVIDRCRLLSNQGYRLALDDFVGSTPMFDELLPIVSIVKIDLSLLERPAITALIQRIRQYPAKLVAERVETQEQFDWASQQGFDYYQGYYFAHPQFIFGKRASPAQLSLLRLLSLALNDADTQEIEEELKKHAYLGVNLMRLVNSAAMGLQQKITSFRHALLILGRRQLRVWLQLLLYTSDSSNKLLANPLLQLAAERAKLMELLAIRQAGEKSELRDLAFMTGILSLMDALLQMPLPEVLSHLNLPETVTDALLDRRGNVGSLLTIIEKLEQQDDSAMEDVHSVLPDLQGNEFTQMQLSALHWASGITSSQ